MTTAEGGFFARLRARVNRGAAFVADLLPGRRIDAELLDELETRLLEADVGVEATQEILADLHRKVARAELADAKALEEALAGSLLAILKPVEQPLAVDKARKPYVILVVGVNGSRSGPSATACRSSRRRPAPIRPQSSSMHCNRRRRGVPTYSLRILRDGCTRSRT